jgi:hypothetical protein
VLAFTAVTTANRAGLAAAVLDTVVVGAAVVVLSLPMVAIGLVIGTGARTQEQVTLATAGALVLAAMVAAFVALGEMPRPPGLAVVPVAGMVSALRDQLAGTGSAAALLVATVSTLTLTWWCTRLAGRLFDGERLVLRGA